MNAVVHGAGLGLRRALLGPLEAQPETSAGIDFLEVAPENWIGIGGRLGKRLRALTERTPLLCHGLSLSLGGPAPLDETLLARIRRFLDEHQVPLYSEHLSFCSDEGHLYDLMPIPFTADAVRHVGARIRRTQDILGRRIAIENVSYYTPVGADMDELSFVTAVLEDADCDLLLDVNNVHVNSINHRYDPQAWIAALPSQRIACMHIAGHYREAEDLVIDTHGAPVVDPVWDLLAAAYRHHGVRPTLLERDFNFPPLADLVAELDTIRTIQAQATDASDVGQAPAQRLGGRG
jgi:uncharacterized protein (UPF0276 family)